MNCKLQHSAAGAAHRVFELEVFVRELLSVYAFAACSIESGKIAALYHEALDHAVKDAAAVAAPASRGASTLANNSYPKPFSPVQSARKFSAVCERTRKTKIP